MPPKTAQPEQTPDPQYITLRPESLQVGMYVDLNCSWFRHPFPRRAFKITAYSQITTIRGLGLKKVLVFPSESDPDAIAAADATGEPEASDVADAPTVTVVADSSPEPAEPPSASDYHEAGTLACEAYRMVMNRSGQMARDLAAGLPAGLRDAQGMIAGLNALLANTEAAGMVASAVDPEDLDNLTNLHALNVATLAMMVAQHFDIDSESMELIGLAALLLDVGEQRLSRKVRLHRAQLSEVDALEYHRHPYHSVEMLRKYPDFPEEVLDIIRNHHERLDGSGYPEKLKGDQLSLPVRIVSAVEHYDALVNHPDPEQAACPAEALSKMFKFQQHLFAPDVVVAMIQTFGVYPPGTVVTLSDGSLGLVLTINFDSRLKPLVMRYDRSADPNAPPIIDLTQESAPVIVRANPREDLPRAVLDYFRLKRWTGYFIQSSIRAAREAA